MSLSCTHVSKEKGWLVLRSTPRLAPAVSEVDVLSVPLEYVAPIATVPSWQLRQRRLGETGDSEAALSWYVLLTLLLYSVYVDVASWWFHRPVRPFTGALWCGA